MKNEIYTINMQTDINHHFDDDDDDDERVFIKDGDVKSNFNVYIMGIVRVRPIKVGTV